MGLGLRMEYLVSMRSGVQFPLLPKGKRGRKERKKEDQRENQGEVILEEPRAAALAGGDSHRTPDSAGDRSYLPSVTLRDSSLQPQDYLPPHHTTPWLPQSVGRANRILHTVGPQVSTEQAEIFHRENDSEQSEKQVGLGY